MKSTVLAAILISATSIGCNQASPPALQQQIVGTWVPQTLDGKPAPKGLGTLSFTKTGETTRGGDRGTFKVVDNTTIETKFGDLSEAMNVEVKGDILIMKSAGHEFQAKRQK